MTNSLPRLVPTTILFLIISAADPHSFLPILNDFNSENLHGKVTKKSL